MIELITGTPGAGKTLRAMWLLEQPEYRGRAVYSNIRGAGHHPLPEGDDWRKTPEGAVVIYDEAQEHFPGTGRSGNSSDERIQAMETHRHTGHDLIFLTQRYALIHHHIRGLVGRHTHLVRKGKKTSVAFVNGETFEPRDRGKLQTVVEEVWRHPVELYDSYVSSSMHTAAQTSYRLPLKIKVLAVVLVFLVAVVAWAGYSAVQGIGSSGESDPEPERIPDNWVPVPAEDSGPAVAEAEPLEELPVWQRAGANGLGGCMASATRCRCWDEQGRPIDLTERECRGLIEEPLHRSITLGGGRRGGA